MSGFLSEFMEKHGYIDVHGHRVNSDGSPFREVGEADKVLRGPSSEYLWYTARDNRVSVPRSIWERMERKIIQQDAALLKALEYVGKRHDGSADCTATIKAINEAIKA